MRRGVEGVDEPRTLPDRRTDPDPVVLGEGKGLEVVEDDRLVEWLHLAHGRGLQQQGRSAQPSRQPRHGRGRTAQGPGDLPVGAARHETGGDGSRFM
jgi:hypothetical protein